MNQHIYSNKACVWQGPQEVIQIVTSIWSTSIYIYIYIWCRSKVKGHQREAYPSISKEFISMTQKDVFVKGARITISQAFTQVIQQLASVVTGTDPGWSLNTRVDGRKPLERAPDTRLPWSYSYDLPVNVGDQQMIRCKKREREREKGEQMESNSLRVQQSTWHN